MNVKMVFTDWLGKEFKSIYRTQVGADLSMGDFHSGTTFEGTICLDPDDQIELVSAMEAGYRPVFCLMLSKPLAADCNKAKNS